jgi:Mg-chelatase subunit ChlD
MNVDCREIRTRNKHLYIAIAFLIAVSLLGIVGTTGVIAQSGEHFTAGEATSTTSEVEFVGVLDDENQNVTLTASGLTTEGKKIESGQVTFTVGGEPVGTAAVSDGSATTEFDPDSLDLQAGQTGIKVGLVGFTVGNSAQIDTVDSVDSLTEGYNLLSVPQPARLQAEGVTAINQWNAFSEQYETVIDQRFVSPEDLNDGLYVSADSDTARLGYDYVEVAPQPGEPVLATSWNLVGSNFDTDQYASQTLEQDLQLQDSGVELLSSGNGFSPDVSVYRSDFSNLGNPLSQNATISPNEAYWVRVSEDTGTLERGVGAPEFDTENPPADSDFDVTITGTSNISNSESLSTQSIISSDQTGIRINAEVTNDGSDSDAQVITLEANSGIGYERVDTRGVELTQGETESISLVYQTGADAPDSIRLKLSSNDDDSKTTINDFETGILDVEDQPPANGVSVNYLDIGSSATLEVVQSESVVGSKDVEPGKYDSVDISTSSLSSGSATVRVVDDAGDVAAEQTFEVDHEAVLDSQAIDTDDSSPEISVAAIVNAGDQVVVAKPDGEVVGTETLSEPSTGGETVAVTLDDLSGVPSDDHTAYVFPGGSLSVGDNINSDAQSNFVGQSAPTKLYDGGLTFEDQAVRSSGNQVVVSSADVGSNGKYAITLHPTTSTGELGQPIGTSQVVQGTSSSTIVDLPSGITPGTYAAKINIAENAAIGSTPAPSYSKTGVVDTAVVYEASLDLEEKVVNSGGTTSLGVDAYLDDGSETPSSFDVTIENENGSVVKSESNLEGSSADIAELSKTFGNQDETRLTATMEFSDGETVEIASENGLTPLSDVGGLAERGLEFNDQAVGTANTNVSGSASGGDVMIAIDTSGSMNGNKISQASSGAQDLVDNLGSGFDVGLVTFDSSATTPHRLADSKSAVKQTLGGLSGNGGTDIGAGIDNAQAELEANGDSATPNYIVVLSDGNSFGARNAATNAKNDDTKIISVAYGSGADENLMEDISSPPKVDDGVIDDRDKNAFDGTTQNIGQVFGQEISQVITGFNNVVVEDVTAKAGESIVVTSDGQQLNVIGSTELEQTVINEDITVRTDETAQLGDYIAHIAASPANSVGGQPDLINQEATVFSAEVAVEDINKQFDESNLPTEIDEVNVSTANVATNASNGPDFKVRLTSQDAGIDVTSGTLNGENDNVIVGLGSDSITADLGKQQDFDITATLVRNGSEIQGLNNSEIGSVSDSASISYDIDKAEFNVDLNRQAFGSEITNVSRSTSTGSGTGDVMIAIDTSGSMNGNKITQASSGAQKLVDNLGSGFDVGLVTFDSSANTRHGLGDSKSSVKQTLGGLGGFGGTDIGAGIDNAQAELEANGDSATPNYIVVLSDGNSFGARNAATDAKNDGTTIISVAYGSGADENLMEDISTNPSDDGVINEGDKNAYKGTTSNINLVFDRQITQNIQTQSDSVLVQNVTADAGQFVVLTEATSQLDTVGFSPINERVAGENISVEVDANATDPDDYIAHLTSGVSLITGENKSTSLVTSAATMYDASISLEDPAYDNSSNAVNVASSALEPTDDYVIVVTEDGTRRGTSGTLSGNQTDISINLNQQPTDENDLVAALHFGSSNAVGPKVKTGEDGQLVPVSAAAVDNVITGRVTASGNSVSTQTVSGGTGIGDLTVEVYNASDTIAGTTPVATDTTENGGAYEVDRLEDGNYTVRIDGGADYANATRNVGNLSNNTVVQEDFALDYSQAGTITGTVTASGATTQATTVPGGQGIDNLTVQLYENASTQSAIKNTTTDSTGSYTFNDVNVDVSDGYRIVADGGLNYTDAAENNVTVDVGATAVEDFQLNYSQSGSIAGIVTASGATSQVATSGSEISGLTVRLIDSGIQLDRTITNGTGYYQFDDIPVDVGSGYTVQVDGGQNYTDEFDTGIKVGVGESVSKDFQMDYDEAGTVTGTITATGNVSTQQIAGSGVGISGLTVELESNSSGSSINTTTTGPSGEYRFTGVSVNISDGYDIEVAGGNNYTDATARGVTVSVDETVTQNFSLDYADFGAIEGTVTASGQTATTQTVDPQDGIGGLTVELYDASSTLVNSTTTDPDGNYTFAGLKVDVDDGYAVEVDGGSNYTSATADNVTVGVDTTVTEDFSLDYATPGTISGTVSDVNGTALSGKTVNLREDAGGTILDSTTTDSSGEYDIGDVDVATISGYTVQVDGGDSHLNDSVTTTVEVDEDVTKDIELKRPGSITGKVTASGNTQTVGTGDAISGRTVELRFTGDPTGKSTTTNGSGFYTFDEVAPEENDDYTVEVDGGVNYTTETQDVTLDSSAQQVTADFQLDYSDPGTINGTLTESGVTAQAADDSISESLTVELYDANDNPSQTSPEQSVTYDTSTDEYEFDSVGVDVDDGYKIFVIGGSSYANTSVTGVTVANDETVTQDIALDYAEPGAITGTVNDSSGQAISGLTVELIGDSGVNPIGTNTTDSSGTYEFTDVDVNTTSGYTVNVLGGQTYNNKVRSGITVGIDKTVIENFTLSTAQNGSITGLVSNASNTSEVLDGLTVELYDSDNNKIANTTTIQSGQYEFDNVVPDTGYEIKIVGGTEYQNDSKEGISVSSGTDVTVDFTLAPETNNDGSTGGSGGQVTVNEAQSSVTPTTIGSGNTTSLDVSVTVENVSISNSQGEVDVDIAQLSVSGDDDVTIDFQDSDINSGTLDITKPIQTTAPSVSSDSDYQINVTDVRDGNTFLIEDEQIPIETVTVEN